MPVQELVAGVHHFRSQVFRDQEALFQRLSEGQEPEVLFITCSDSRIDPNLITNTDPGDLFMLRNVGNLIPPYGASNGGEAATIEYAVRALNIKDIVVCGHSNCGAMAGLLHPERVTDLRCVSDWLQHAEITRQIVAAKYQHLSGEQLLAAAIEENVLAQIENLQTHPAVAAKLSQGTLKLHAWYYSIASGGVFAYDQHSNQFRPIGAGRPDESAVAAATGEKPLG